MDVHDVQNKLKSGECKAVENKEGKSQVWKSFFLVVDGNTNAKRGCVQCKLCEAVLSYTGSSSGTSHLTRHANACKHVASPSVKSYFNPVIANVPQSAKSEVTKSCVQMCAKDLRPFDIVGGTGFQQVCQALIKIGSMYGNVRVQDVLPHPTTVSRNARLEAENKRQEIVPEIQSAIDIGLCSATTDMWTDDYRKISYTTVTVHYLTEQWEMKSRVLFTADFPLEDRRTAENIRRELSKNFSKLGFKTDILSKLVFVTDQGSNIVAALQTTVRLNCTCHLLNTILRNTFSDKFMQENLSYIALLFDELKSLVTYLKQSGLVNQLEKTVHQECESRWYSRHELYESVDENYDAIENILVEKDQLSKLDHIPRHLLKMLTQFLLPFKETSLELESDKHPTLPLVLLVRAQIMEHLKPKSDEHDDIVVLKDRAMQFLEKKFIIHKLHRLATFLWPDFRQLRMLSEEEKTITLNDVREKIEELQLQRQPPSTATTLLLRDAAPPMVQEGSSMITEEPSTSRTQVPPPTKKSKFLDFSTFADKKTISEREDDEIDRYMAMDVNHLQLDALLPWWKSHEAELPLLSQLAKRILSVPASSASSERNFSTAGYIYQERRTSLSSDTLDALLFLHNNM